MKVNEKNLLIIGRNKLESEKKWINNEIGDLNSKYFKGKNDESVESII